VTEKVGRAQVGQARLIERVPEKVGRAQVAGGGEKVGRAQVAWGEERKWVPPSTLSILSLQLLMYILQFT
jgi:hypothetical protein